MWNGTRALTTFHARDGDDIFFLPDLLHEQSAGPHDPAVRVANMLNPAQSERKKKKMHKQHLVQLVAGTALALVSVIIPSGAGAQATTPRVVESEPPRPQMPPFLAPSKEVDLMTLEGTAVFGAQWKTMEAKIVEGAPIVHAKRGYRMSYDIQPHAGEAGFDDSSWPAISAKSLADQRGGGKVSFIWYRTNLTMPAKIQDFDTKGATAVLTVIVDDYAEIWINGQMPRRVGYPSPATIQGFNMPNRVVLTDAVIPGDKFQIAVFGINGPISTVPMNFVFFREAKMEFFR